MSYYSSSTLLDSYTTSRGYGDSLYSNTYNTSYGGGGAGSSAIDRYYSYLDDLTSSRTSDYGSSSSTTASSSRYSSRYSSTVSDHSSGYGGSGSSRTNSYLSDFQPVSSRYSSSYGRSLISKAPAYDKYGKELSNYDRWRLNQGEHVSSDTTNNNTYSSSYLGSSSSTNNNESKNSTTYLRGSRRISRLEDSITNDSVLTTTPAPLNTSRELSVMPTVSNSYPEDLAALPSRFAQMNTRESRLARETGAVQKQRGKSVAPNLLSSSYSNTSSSFGSRGGSSSSKFTVHSFPLSVSSKVSEDEFY